MTTPPDEQELASLLAKMKADHDHVAENLFWKSVNLTCTLAPELLTRLASLRAEVARLREALAPFIRLSLAVVARDARDGLGGLEAEKQVHRLTTDDFRRAAALASDPNTEVEPTSDPDPGGHEWFFPRMIAYHYCRKCGVVKRPDGKNGPCRGVPDSLAGAW